jgi:hypothetical protein
MISLIKKAIKIDCSDRFLIFLTFKLKIGNKKVQIQIKTLILLSETFQKMNYKIE